MDQSGDESEGREVPHAGSRAPVTEVQEQRPQQEPVRCQRRVPDAAEQRRYHDEECAAEDAERCVPGPQSRDDRARRALGREAEEQPDAEVLQRRRQPRREQLERDGDERDGVGEPDGGADRRVVRADEPWWPRPRLVAEEVPAHEVVLPIELEHPVDGGGRDDAPAGNPRKQGGAEHGCDERRQDGALRARQRTTHGTGPYVPTPQVGREAGVAGRGRRAGQAPARGRVGCYNC